jgi:hypothetical protein
LSTKIYAKIWFWAGESGEITPPPDGALSALEGVDIDNPFVD